MFQSAHYSKNFFQLLDVWPKGFLPFPTSELRGLAQSKATIIIENISTKYVVFRIIQEQNCSLSLRCRPMIDILEPNTVQKIEILNDSGKLKFIKSNFIRFIKYENNSTSS